MFVESWHATLKRSYLRIARKQRTDSLVHKLFNEYLLKVRLKVALVKNGFGIRTATDTEKRQRDLCDAIVADVAESYLRFPTSLQPGDQFGNEVMVRSPVKENVHYIVSLNDGEVSSCSCLFMASSNVVCKHTLLAVRVLGYSICYDVRRSGNSRPSHYRTSLPSNDHNDPSHQEQVNANLRRSLEAIKPFVKAGASTEPSE
ncbi:hypothetical protein K3495_g5262 [Podosphaera aphanis]|nr:hypothetical protein K3495_g5262 [Podosphaera aphanis]